MRKATQTWPQFRSVFRQSHRFDEVRRRLGLPAGLAERLEAGEAVAQARRLCVECRDGRKCDRWLEASIALAAPPLFCPNTNFFGACAANATKPPETPGKPC